MRLESLEAFQKLDVVDQLDPLFAAPDRHQIPNRKHILFAAMNGTF